MKEESSLQLSLH